VKYSFVVNSLDKLKKGIMLIQKQNFVSEKVNHRVLN